MSSNHTLNPQRPVPWFQFALPAYDSISPLIYFLISLQHLAMIFMFLGYLSLLRNSILERTSLRFRAIRYIATLKLEDTYTHFSNNCIIMCKKFRLSIFFPSSVIHCNYLLQAPGWYLLNMSTGVRYEGMICKQ